MAHIAAGTYVGVPMNWGLGEAGTGTPQVAVEFKVFTEGEKKEVGSITWYGYLSDKTYERTVKALRVMGWKGNDLADLSTISEECQLVIKEEPKQDGSGTRSVVNFINPPGGGGRAFQLKAPLEGDKLKRFAAEMKAKIAAVSVAASNNAGSNGSKPPPF